MGALLQWELSLPGHGGRVLERVMLGDDGAVERVVLEPGDPAQADVGWWDGTLDDESLAPARTLATSPWPSSGSLPSPPAAGAWRVSGPNGVLPLWSADSGDEADAEAAASALRAQLAAVRATCAAAATRPRCVGRFTATWGPVDDEWFPVLHVEAAGRERLAFWLDNPPDAPLASFLTDQAEVLGYSGSEVWVPARVAAFALLRDRQPGPLGLEISGRIADESGTRLPFRAVVAVSDG